MALMLRRYWGWLGRLRLSRPGRALFTAVWLLGLVETVIAHLHGAREGGAPLVVMTLLLIGVIALDTIGRGVVLVLRRLL